jgi:hypothetical protein
MQTISTVAELRASISELEARNFHQELALREAATEAFESLNPLNIIKNTFKSAIANPISGKSVLNGTIGLALGIISKKIITLGSKNIFRKILGTVVEIGVARAATNNAERIKSGGLQLIKKVVQ